MKLHRDQATMSMLLAGCSWLCVLFAITVAARTLASRTHASARSRYVHHVSLACCRQLTFIAQVLR